MRAEWRSLDERINSLNDDLTEHARADEAASRLTSIPGIGVLGATALVAAVGDGEAFRRARDIPAWLGLVPKQMRSEEHTSELQSLMRISYAVFCLKKKKK